MEFEKKTLNYSEEDMAEKNKENVSLFYNDALYLGYGKYDYNIYIRVKNIDYKKKVILHYDDGQGWKEAEGVYVNKLNDNNYDIFKVSLDTIDSIKYFITYEVNGKVYKDDNNKKYYTDEALGTAPMCAIRSSGVNEVYLRVKKYENKKKLFVHYTADNWRNVKSDIELVKVENYNDNTELWKATLDTGRSKEDIKYAFYLKLYGNVYWDNNFGLNYDESFSKVR
ncbi:Starch/carbohydrate-binding module (family 53) [Clostridium sp. DSM 8431]|uniref:carbohydrate-binding protein n=1 Tax=Clostridium sp. DSM 8431 TaxID=1761781 RepID=UPI0008E08F3C|nr:carbohydrate-binding protein [Clostridium sp. DSM 8431]SFU79195.1 Starch/carbohydrate-binding module (family 53) [Clostridium sp. DSM 8431]